MFWFWLACAAPPADTDDTETVETDVADPRYDRTNWPSTVGGDRPASVVYPADWDGTPLPLFILLHGYGASGVVQDGYFGLSARADRGFAVVLPDGTLNRDGSRFWNATDFCCNFGGADIDDVAYVTSLIDEMEAKVAIDPARVVLIGHSNGGFMSYRMACDRPDRIAGIASLAGTTWKDESRCAGTTAVPVLHMHGTVDETIFYDGAPEYPGAEDTVARWRARNGCADPVTDGPSFDFDRRVADAETTTSTQCDVTLWKMSGSTHIPALSDAWKDAIVDWALAQRR
jgi:polyhydroxybutyrate depolymerase